MNKIHKTIWNSSLESWVAVSEVSRKKSKNKRNAAIAASLISISAILTQRADAACNTNNGLHASGEGTVCDIVDGTYTNTQNYVSVSATDKAKINSTGTLTITTDTPENAVAGVYVNNATINIKDLNIDFTASYDGSRGILSKNNGSLIINGDLEGKYISIVPNTSGSNVFLFSDAATIHVKEDVQIKLHGERVVGVSSTNRGTTQIDGLTTVIAESGFGVHSQISGSKTILGDINIRVGLDDVDGDGLITLQTGGAVRVRESGFLQYNNADLESALWDVIYSNNSTIIANGSTNATIHSDNYGGIHIESNAKGTFNKLEIQLNGANNYGIKSSSNSNVTLNGTVDIKTLAAALNSSDPHAANSTGLYAITGGKINLNNKLTSFTSGIGIYSENKNSSIILNSAELNISGATAIKAEAGGLIEINGTTKVISKDTDLITASNTEKSIYLWANGSGSKIKLNDKYTAQTAGIAALATNYGLATLSDADLEVVDATTPSSSNFTPIGVQAKSYGVINVNSGIITVKTDDGIAAQAQSNGQVNLNGVDIDLINKNSIGAQASDRGVMSFTAGEIKVKETGAKGAQATTGGTVELKGGVIKLASDKTNLIGAQVLKNGNVILDGTDIQALGDAAIGLEARDQGIATMNSGSITLQGSGSTGAQAVDQGILKLKGGVISTNGNNGTAIKANINSEVNFVESGTGIRVNLTGINNTALVASGINSKITGGAQVVINSSADGSTAVRADSAGVVDMTGGSLIASVKGVGAIATGTDSKISLFNAEITSTDSYALHATSGGAINSGANIISITQADSMHAALVDSGGRLTGKKIDLSTSGDNAAGLAVTSGAPPTSKPDVSVETLKITVSGQSSDGIRIGDANTSTAGNVYVTGSVDITALGTTGSSATGCNAASAICLTGDNSKFELAGAQRSVITSNANALRMSTGNDMSMALNNAGITVTNSQPAISIHQVGGTSVLTLQNSQVNRNQGDSLLSIDFSSELTLNSIQSTLYGIVNASPSSVLNMNLKQGSLLQGSFSGIARLSIDADSTWEVVSNSNLYQIENAGTIDFTEASTLSTAYRTVTVDGYKGDGGNIYFDTFLAGDTSSSDMLVIKKNLNPNPNNDNPEFSANTSFSGQAIGTTHIHVTNRGGLGAYSTGKGIKVVDADTDPNASTTVDAFVQGHQISAGAYDYTLYRNADQSWYLYSSKNQTDPDYSDESSTTTVLGPMAQIYGYAVLGSWRERMGGMAYGDISQNVAERDAIAPLWVRVGGGKGTHVGGQQFMATANSVAYSPDYKYDFNFLQMGGDVYQGINSKGTRSAAGLYFATGQIYGDVKTYDEVTGARNSQASRASADNISFGAYWTVVAADGSYVDVVGQFTEHDLTVRGNSDNITTTGHSWTASVEAGKSFSANSQWSLAPQAQLKYQQTSFGRMDAIASGSKVGEYDFNNNASLEARIGLEARYKTKPLSNAWVRLDLLHEFKGEYKSSYKSVQSSANKPEFTSSLKGSSLELRGGMDYELQKNVSLYGTLGYRHGLSNSSDHSWNAQVGVRWGF